MTGIVTHFEIYGEEPAELAEFYGGMFGWKLEKAPGIDYWRIQTESKSSGFDGGLTYRPSDAPRSWLHYVTVASVDDAISRAERGGASILRAKTAVPRTGWYAVIADPQGNSFGVWQSDPSAFPPPEPD